MLKGVGQPSVPGVIAPPEPARTSATTGAAPLSSPVRSSGVADTTTAAARPTAPSAKPAEWVAPSAPTKAATVELPILTQHNLAALIEGLAKEGNGARGLVVSLFKRFGGDLLEAAVGTKNELAATPTAGYLGMMKPGQTWDQFIATAYAADLAKLPPEQRAEQIELTKRTVILLNAYLATEIGTRRAIESGELSAGDRAALQAFRAQAQSANIARLSENPREVGLIAIPSGGFVHEVESCFVADDQTFEAALAAGQFTYLKNVFGSDEQLRSTRSALREQWAASLRQDPSFGQTLGGVDHSTGVGAGAGASMVAMSLARAAPAPDPDFVGPPDPRVAADPWELLDNHVNRAAQRAEVFELPDADEEAPVSGVVTDDGVEAEDLVRDPLADPKKAVDRADARAREEMKNRLSANAGRALTQDVEAAALKKQVIKERQATKVATNTVENQAALRTGKNVSGPLGGGSKIT